MLASCSDSCPMNVSNLASSNCLILKKWVERNPLLPTSDPASDSDSSWKDDARAEIQSLLSEELERVTDLHLQGPEAAESEIEALGVALQQRPFPGIQHLRLCNGRVGVRALAELGRAIEVGNLGNLRLLDLSGTRLDDDGAREVAGMLASGNLSSLTNLHLLRTDVGDMGLAAIAQALKSGGVSDLKSLSIGSGKQNLVHQGTDALGKSFRSMPHLEDLQMQGIVNEQAAICVVDALTSGMVGRIKSLELSYCGIGYQGAMAIANGLESLNFASLECLDVSNNLGMWMGDEGVVALSRALKTIFLYNLRKLVLNNVAMGERGLLELASVLEADDLPGLQELHVQDSGNTETSARALVKAYQANPFLVAQIFVAWPDPSYKNNAEGFRRQNLKLVPSLKVLMDEPNVPVTRARIFLCGHPRVGKTTLKKSLARPQGRKLPKAPVCRCVAPGLEADEHEHEQAFEIELSRLVHRHMFLGVWDLAGQPELHMLHSPSLPHLAFAAGEATLFVVVCSANYGPEATEREAKRELEYWLRYISSNSVKRKTKGDGKRHHVLLVLNSFHGQHSCHSRSSWEHELRRCQREFDEFLDIHHAPFIVDFHNRKDTKSFKHSLTKRLREFLRLSEPVPQICSQLQQRISRWAKKPQHHRFPVLLWREFRSKVLGSVFDNVSESNLAAAMDYLHEAGQVIFFREDVLKHGGLLCDGLVVLDPALFWESILGRRLLGLDCAPLRANVHPSGALPIDVLHEHLADQLSDAAHVQQVVAMLMPLGLAYRFRSDIEHIFIPALIEHDNVPPYWGPEPNSSNSHWIMGFAMQVTSSGTTLLPNTVFRKLQMELAREQDEFGEFSSSEFCAGKNIVAFRNPEMAVAVQYSGDPLNRVDVLTKPQAPDDQVDEKELQVNLAQAISETFERIANETCPGVEFSRRVIEPWSSSEGLSRAMDDRNVAVAVEELKALLKSGGIGARTKMAVGREPVYAMPLLSGKDITDLRLCTKEECAVIEQTILHLELFALSVDPTIAMHAASLKAKAEMVHTTREDEHEQQQDTKSYTLEKFFSRRVDEAMLDRAKDNIRTQEPRRASNFSPEQILQREFDNRKSLGNQIQTCIRFSVVQEDSSMARLLFLTHQEDGSSGQWMRLENALLLRQNCRIHFLCEDHALHEVRGQEGFELSQLNELGNKLGPLLEWSLKIAFVTCKIGRTAVLPGLDLLLRDGRMAGSKLTSTAQLAKISFLLKNFASAGSNDILKSRVPLSEIDPRVSMSNVCSTTAQEVASVRHEVSAALRVLLATMSPTERMQKLGLRRVMLASAQKLWICSDCYAKYGSPPEV
ncbi:hypothetical protein AXG93_1474s1220 [Marchantia polymorpha subsp. ruderalis]|uniref:C-terminal of Roc (COR) domain-containing protein n=1 Tax=Marchantia polymorpha subsp. ruderalis TaxID=1480154 RepID=A0A176WD82_MARPO|nr:hypothetical protein AXG93_1474s1220 [Marchantia polymorpha subsp. ruderalis]